MNELFLYLLPFLIPLVAALIVYLLRLMGVTVAQKILEDILKKLAEICFEVENLYKGREEGEKAGQLKKEAVVALAEQRLKPKELSYLRRKLGSVSEGVEYAFNTIVQPVLSLHSLGKTIKNLFRK